MKEPWTLQYLSDWAVNAGLQPKLLQSGKGIVVSSPGDREVIFSISIGETDNEFSAEIAISNLNTQGIGLQEMLLEKYDLTEPEKVSKWPRLMLADFDSEALDLVASWAKEHVITPWSPKPQPIEVPIASTEVEEPPVSPSVLLPEPKPKKKPAAQTEAIYSWLKKFLSYRGLDRPDGRPLYAYKTSDTEYQNVKKQFQLAAHFRQQDVFRKDRKFDGLFVLFAAEWWRREYTGGSWSWNPMLEALGLGYDAVTDIRTSPQQLLYPALERGFRFWKREIFATGRARTFIGSVAVEGGLPLNLLTDPHAGLQRFFRHLLDRYLPLRMSGIPAIHIASELQNDLPASFRRDTVYRVAGDIIESTLALRSQYGLENQDDPVGHLDRICPEWRDNFSLSLDNEPAQALLRALVVDVSKSGDSGLPLALNRYISQGMDGIFRLQARIDLGRKLSIASLSLLFGEIEWPSQLEIWLLRPFKTRLALLSRYDDKNYRVRSEGVTWRGRDALEEAVVGLFSYENVISDERILPSSLMEEDLPWIFVEGEDRLGFLGQGGMSLAAESVTLVIPESAKILSDGDAPTLIGTLEDGNREIYESSGLTKVVTDEGEFVIRTRQSRLDVPQYELVGNRLFKPANVRQVFLGVPKLRCRNMDGSIIPLHDTQVVWRYAGDKGAWKALSAAVAGVVDIKAIKGSELLFRACVAILPGDTRFHASPGNNQLSGTISVTGLDGTRFASGCDEVKLESSTRQATATVLQLAVTDDKRSSFPLHIQWTDSPRSLVLDMPVPIAGAKFGGDKGLWLENHAFVAVSDLAGIHAVGFNYAGAAPEKFYMDINIHADDLRAADHRALGDRIPLPRMGEVSELPLIQLRDRFQHLFSLSEDLDCRIELTLEGKRTYGRMQVARYTSQLKVDGDVISLTSAQYRGTVEQDIIENLELEAHSLLDPIEHGQRLERRLTQGVSTGEWDRPLGLKPGPWLLMPCKEQNVPVRPTVTGQPGYVFKEDGRLRDAIAVDDTKECKRQIAMCIEQMVGRFDHKDWSLVFETLRAFHHLPATTLNLWDCLARNPRGMAMLLIKADQSNYQMVIDAANELPFLWELVPLSAWISSFQQLKGFILESAPPEIGPSLVQHMVKEKLGYLMEADPLLESIAWLVSERVAEQDEQELRNAERFSGQAFADVVFGAAAEKLRTRQSADVHWAEFHGDLLRDVRLNSPESTAFLYTQQASYMVPVLHAPVAMAIRVCAQSSSTHARLSNTDLYQLQQIRRFDELWYREAFSITTLYLYSQDLLIYEENEENSQ